MVDFKTTYAEDLGDSVSIWLQHNPKYNDVPTYEQNEIEDILWGNDDKNIIPIIAEIVNDYSPLLADELLDATELLKDWADAGSESF